VSSKIPSILKLVRIASILDILADGTYNLSIQSGEGSVVSTISRSYSVVTDLLASSFLNDRLTRQGLGVLAIILGDESFGFIG